MNRSTAAEFLLLAAVWGASFLFMREASLSFGPWTTAGLRVGIACLALMPLLVWQGHWSDWQRHWRAIMLLGVFNSALPFALYSYALLSISTGLSSILNATSPLFGALVGWVWLGERPQRWRSVGLLFGFIGVALLSWDQASFKPGGSGWAVLACLGATLCYGVAANFTRKRLMGVPTMATAAGSQLGATLALALPAWAHWPAEAVPLSAWLAVLVAGLVCTALAYVLFFRLIARTGASQSLAVTFLIPVFALLYGALLLNESITPTMVAGGVVIVVGVALATGWLTPRWPRPAPHP